MYSRREFMQYVQPAHHEAADEAEGSEHVEQVEEEDHAGHRRAVVLLNRHACIAQLLLYFIHLNITNTITCMKCV